MNNSTYLTLHYNHSQQKPEALKHFQL